MQDINTILRKSSNSKNSKNSNTLIQRISSVAGTITTDEWNQCLAQILPKIAEEANFHQLCNRMKMAQLTLKEGSLQEVFCQYLRKHYFKKWVAEYDDFSCSLNSEGAIELSAEEQLSLFEFFTEKPEHVSGFIDSCVGREPLIINGEPIDSNPLYNLYKDAWGSVKAQDNANVLFATLISLVSGVDIKYEKFIRYLFAHAQCYKDLSKDNRGLLLQAYQKLQYGDITGYLELPEDMRRSEWLAKLFVTTAKEAEAIYGYVTRYMAKQFPQSIELQPWYQGLRPENVAIPSCNRGEKDYYLYGLLPKTEFDALLASITDECDLTGGDGYYLTAPTTENNPEGRGERLYATTVFHYILSAPLAEKEKDYRIAEIISKFPALEDVMLKKVQLNRNEINGGRTIQNNVYSINVEIDDEYSVLIPNFTSKYARLYSLKHDTTMTNREKFVIGLISGDLSFLINVNYANDYLLDRYFMDLINRFKPEAVLIDSKESWCSFTQLMQSFSDPDAITNFNLLETGVFLHFGMHYIMQQEVTEHNSRLFDLYFDAIVRHGKDSKFYSSRLIVMLFAKLRPTDHLSDIGSIDSYQDYVWTYDPTDWEAFKSHANKREEPTVSGNKESSASEYFLSLVTSFASFVLALTSWAIFGSMYTLSVISTVVLSLIGLLSAYEAVDPGVLPEVINPGRSIPHWFGFSLNHEDANLMKMSAMS